MTQLMLHQVIIGATIGDAITDQAFLLRRWLREMGFISEIFAEYIHPALAQDIHPINTYQSDSTEKWLIYHHSIGSAVVDRLLSWPLQLILIYHNVTPPEFFINSDPTLAQQLATGKEQLLALRTRTKLALADSAFNEAELCTAGFQSTSVLPIVLDENRYQLPSNPKLLTQFEGLGPRLLFVGRLVPNKKQEDLIKLLYFYRRINPSACLILAGERWLRDYDLWLHDLALGLGLEKAVFFMGHVSQQDMLTCYRLADIYISMSEHEGFGKPLIESMYLGLPVVAYAAAAVPDTMGGAGILVHHKDYEAVAELIDLLLSHTQWRARLVEQQRQHARNFLETQVRPRWEKFVVQVYDH